MLIYDTISCLYPETPLEQQTFTNLFNKICQLDSAVSLTPIFHHMLSWTLQP